MGPEEPKIPWTKLVSRIRKRVQHRSQRDHKKAVRTLKSSIAHLLDHEGNVSAYDATCFKIHAGAIVVMHSQIFDAHLDLVFGLHVSVLDTPS